MCGATQVEDLSLGGVDINKEAVIQGLVNRSDGEPAAGAYVRLLDSNGDFTAEVVTSASGAYRFHARPGDWNLRALASGGASGDATASADYGRVERVDITVQG
ncbi:MAG: DUF1416 domain-containing protein [Frankiaceae bacterium]|nr:DUF1416 domain-containing protein [Frankiaceae bacterium]